jgi:hypothetical protein
VSFSEMLAYTGLAAIILGVLGSLRPLWRSRTLSPTSIERRVYWAGTALGIALLFASQLPDWRRSLFIALAAAIVMVVMAFGRTPYIKIGGRIYAAYRLDRQPDPPPELAPTNE